MFNRKQENRFLPIPIYMKSMPRFLRAVHQTASLITKLNY
jgi:hypothetical protein